MINSDLDEQQIWGRVYAALKLCGHETYSGQYREINFENLIYEIEEAVECGDLVYCDEILKKIGY